jgi:sugar phosphate isomerase/epimerase
VELGFDVVEFGAAHIYEDNILSVLRKVKKDFPHVNFTIHTLFPPLRNRTWFNPANGLSKLNKKIVDGLFWTADIVDAMIISIHLPIFYDIELRGKFKGGFYRTKVCNPKDEYTSKKNFSHLMGYILKRNESSGRRIILENMCSSLSSTYPFTKYEFLEFFNKFTNTGMLLDVGHALQSRNLNELLALDENIFELHLHEIGYTPGVGMRGHFPIKEMSYFDPLKKIIRKDSVIPIFEHGADVTEEDIINEKCLLEKFLKTN